MGGNLTRVREMRNMCKILVEKPEGTRPLGILRCRCEDSITVNITEIDGRLPLDSSGLE